MPSRHLFLAALGTLLLASTVRAQTVYFVDADASGANTGTSWADAFTDVQSALATAQDGDALWVAEGSYRPTDDSDRTATFQLKSGVALYGGFSGTESSLDERDWAAHPTILSGDIGAPGTKTDNSYHVVTGSGTDATAVLDGFIVTAAYASGSGFNRGGGMRNDGGSPTVRHCIFHENEARTNGLASIGAGMFNINGSSPLLEDVRFERNVSQQQSGGLGNRVNSNPTLRRVVFIDNEAGALGGGMTNETGSAPVLIDVQFIRNTSGGWTGGLDNYQASPTLYNVVFYGNTCENYGCGMTNDTNANTVVVNALFVGNRKMEGGQAGAAGLQNNGSSPTLVGVTFVGNTAPDGSADGFGHRGTGSPVLRDVIFWDNGDEIVDEAGSAIDLSHGVVEGGFPSGASVLDTDPQFIRTPSSGPDGTWGTPDDDYGDLRLSTGSPALDAGDASHLPADLADLDGDGDTTEPVPFDLSGGARVLGGALDLGAYEGAINVSSEPSAPDGGVELGALYPNPASGPVTFEFSLSNAAHVRVLVFDVLGREVARLLDAPRQQGQHAVSWLPHALSGGHYSIALDVNGVRHYRRITLLPS